MKIAVALSAAALALPGPALAGEAFLGAYAHAVDLHVAIDYSDESGAQIVGGYRTDPVDALHVIGRPRLYVLGAANTAGGIDYAAAGLGWRFDLGKRFYVEPGIGGAVHSGDVNFPSPFDPGLSAAEQARRLDHVRHDLDLGSRVLFEPELSLGWRATDRLAFEASWIHLSHAQLAGRQNPGLDDVGVRAVYRFGP
jgi:lipid A 3-O-deacylase